MPRKIDPAEERRRILRDRGILRGQLLALARTLDLPNARTRLRRKAPGAVWFAWDAARPRLTGRDAEEHQDLLFEIAESMRKGIAAGIADPQFDDVSLTEAPAAPGRPGRRPTIPREWHTSFADAILDALSVNHGARRPNASELSLRTRHFLKERGHVVDPRLVSRAVREVTAVRGSLEDPLELRSSRDVTRVREALDREIRSRTSSPDHIRESAVRMILLETGASPSEIRKRPRRRKSCF